MDANYFEVQPTAPQNSWILAEPTDEIGAKVDPRIFRQGRRVDRKWYGKLSFTEKRIGNPMDFTLGPSCVPIVKKSIAEAISLEAPFEIERISVDIVGHPGEYEILNVINAIDCIDESRTTLDKWKESDGKPENIGKYKMVIGLTIDPSKCDEQNIFRIKGWQIALIVSERIQRMLLKLNVSGITFKCVS